MKSNNNYKIEKMNKEQIKNAVRDIVGLLETWAESYTEKNSPSVVISTSHHSSRDAHFWDIYVSVHEGDRYQETLFYDNMLVCSLTTHEEIEEFLKAAKSFLNQ